jgi:hypothetical protein
MQKKLKTQKSMPGARRGGAAKERQKAKRKTQKSKPGVPRSRAARENQKAKGKGKKSFVLARIAGVII